MASSEALLRPRSRTNAGFKLPAPKRLPALSTATPTSLANSFFSKLESVTPASSALKRPIRLQSLRSRRDRMQRSRMRPGDNNEDMYSLAEFRYLLFRKGEIMRSRQLPCAQQPFWYVDSLYDEELQCRSELVPQCWEQMGSRRPDDLDYREWLSHLQSRT